MPFYIPLLALEFNVAEIIEVTRLNDRCVLLAVCGIFSP